MPLDDIQALPRELSSYAHPIDASILQVLAERIRIEPFNAIATAIFLLAIVHTFSAAVSRSGPTYPARGRRTCSSPGSAPRPSVAAEALHFLGEVEVVFGLWAVVLLVAMSATPGGTRRRTTSTTP